MEKDYNSIKESLISLLDIVKEIDAKPTQKPQILDRELSGNKINGGKITNFSSVGIKDEASKQILVIHDTGIVAEHAQIANLDIPVDINADLTVHGEIKAKKIKVDEISADLRLTRSSSLEFKNDLDSIHGKGLIWTGKDYTKQFIYLDPGKLFSSEDIDLYKDKCYRIENLPVLTKTSLGPSVQKSSLTELGTVQNLKTSGNCTIDNFIFWDSENERLGIGTDEPKGLVSLKTLDHEFMINQNQDKGFTVGSWSSTSLHLITDNVSRLNILANGNIVIKNKTVIEHKLGVGVQNFEEDVDITTAGPVRFQNKKFENADTPPTFGNYIKGDIVWNKDPKPTGYVGWICIREGAPGEWKAFGLIQQ